jgi:hypothetical protein
MDSATGRVYCEIDDELCFIAGSMGELLEATGCRDRIGSASGEVDIVTAIGSAGDYELLERFIADGGDLQRRNVEGFTIGDLAAKSGEMSILQRFLDAGGSLRGLLKSVMRMGRGAPLIDFLLSRGADPEEVDELGQKPYDYGMPFMRKYLIAKAARFPGARESNG